jgi:hypothetical protein
MEHGGPGLLVDGGPAAPPQRLSELLPGAFDAADIGARGTRTTTGGHELDVE